MKPYSFTRVRRVIAPITLSVVFVVAVAACGSSPSGAAGGTDAARSALCSKIPAGPIKIYNVVPLSGPTASSGQGTAIETTIAVNYFNAHESVCGHKFQLITDNDKGDPATALSFGRQIVSSGNSIILWDSFGSPADAMQPYLMQQHVLVLNGNAAETYENPQQNPTGYSVLPSNKQNAQFAVNWAVSHHYNDIGSLNDGTSAGTEMATDVENDAKAAGLTYIKTVTYSPTALDLTVPITQARQDGIKTVIQTGFTAIPQMVQAMKQIGWSPHLIGSEGVLAGFGLTQAQVPAGTVDQCYYYYTPGQPTSTLLTPTVAALLKASAAKIGINPQTSSVLLEYNILTTLKYAVQKADSVNGAALAAVLGSSRNVPTVIPGVSLSWHANQFHNGWPFSELRECTLQTGPYDIRYVAAAG